MILGLEAKDIYYQFKDQSIHNMDLHHYVMVNTYDMIKPF
jgi:hypothetical protein